MRNGLRDKVVVVTGASSGVGRAIARALGEQGSRVALIARGEDGLKAAAREIRDAGGSPLVLPADVSDASAIEQAADDVVAEWGQLDVWINDAMVSVFAPTWRISPAEFRRVTEVNYLGFVNGTLAALKHMRPLDRGTIVQIGSAVAYRSIPLQSAYCGSKAAIRGFTDSLRCELAHERSGVALTMVHLPAVNTPQFNVVRNKLPEHPYPVPPVFQPEVIARAVLYAIRHPRREYWVAGSTVKAIIGQKVIPGWLDRYLGKMAWEGQQTDRLPLSKRDNLDSPIPGDRGAHGPFDSDARDFSTLAWARAHPRTVGGIGLGIAALAAWSVARAKR